MCNVSVNILVFQNFHYVAEFYFYDFWFLEESYEIQINPEIIKTRNYSFLSLRNLFWKTIIFKVLQLEFEEAIKILQADKIVNMTKDNNFQAKNLQIKQSSFKVLI